MDDDVELNSSGPKRTASFGRSSSADSSLRRRFSNVLPHDQLDDEAENDSVSEAGDIGDRAVLASSNRNSFGGCSRRLSNFDNVGESSVVVPISEITSTDKKEEDEKEVSWILEYISCLAFLALFGILGVIVRFYLQKLFGPGVAGATSEKSYMYPDLPSNMVGSFLMGWLGVVFKGDISKVSNNLAIGLTTGFLGSLTTFSGWNQIMLGLSVEGSWDFSVLGILVGIFLVHYSIIFGIETAEGFKRRLEKSNIKLKLCYCKSPWKLDSNKRNLTVTFVLLLILCIVWGICIDHLRREFKSENANSQLLLACIVGPFGVWLRWWLARLNGRGFGKRGLLKWIPFGTLAANVLASSIMAALAILKKAVKTNTFNTIATGIQLGFLGCLSTVSTFIAEFHAMKQSKYPTRAFAYATSTIVISFALGTLIYSLPVWIGGYD